MLRRMVRGGSVRAEGSARRSGQDAATVGEASADRDGQADGRGDRHSSEVSAGQPSAASAATVMLDRQHREAAAGVSSIRRSATAT
jgi:hypothetical protein